MSQPETKVRESRISAHHNYLVNGIITPGFVVGDPNEQTGFFFLADVVLPGEGTPRISARLVEGGEVLLELSWNRIRQNRGSYVHQSVPGGFRITHGAAETVLEVRTQAFANGYLTHIMARLTDEEGRLRMEPSGESVRIHGPANLVLDAPFVFDREAGN